MLVYKTVHGLSSSNDVAFKLKKYGNVFCVNDGLRVEIGAGTL